MDKPSQDYTLSPRSSGVFMPDFIPDPSLRGQSFDQLLQNRGIRFLHQMAVPCPNMKSVNTNNHHPECPFCDDSQIIHLPGKEIWGVFTNNTLEKMFEVQGVWEIGTAIATFPTEYGDGTQADFNTFDRLVCPDFQVRLTDIKEYEVTSDGKQSLRYPIVKIEYMASVRSGVMYEYTDGVDYTIEDGDIKWISGKEPYYNDLEEVGEVLSITYVANPVYAVLNVMHELRVTQEYDFASGKKIARRLPQQVLVKRDFLVNDADKE